MSEQFGVGLLYPPRVGMRVRRVGHDDLHGVVRSVGGQLAFVHWDGDAAHIEHLIRWTQLQPEEGADGQERVEQ